MSRRRDVASTIFEVEVFQSRAGFSECLDTVGFRDVSQLEEFQSRAGFSECLDASTKRSTSRSPTCFNPVLGFLSVSTGGYPFEGPDLWMFQSRAGFSECLDSAIAPTTSSATSFQSRAGFSECLDRG